MAIPFGDEEKTEISQSATKKIVPVPDVPFETFYKKFKTVREVKQTKEWKEIYSNYYEFSDYEEDIEIGKTKADLETYDIERQEEEWIKCSRSFTYFCIKYAILMHPIFGPIPLIPYSYQRRVVEKYGTHRFNILSKFRQGGLTTVSVAWAVWRCIFRTSQKIMVVSKTDREAIAAGEIAKTIVEYLPDWLKPETDKWNEHEKQFKTTDSILWFYTVEAARGKSITVLIIDEAAFIKDMDRHWKALLPTLGTGGSCIAISTVNGLGNWYADIYHEAEEGKNKFNIIEIDYWEHPLYNDPKWIDEMRSNLGEKGWNQEIERSFGGSGNNWINTVLIKEIIQATKDRRPGKMLFPEWKNRGVQRRVEWDEGAYWEWQRPADGHSYIIGVDAADGNGEMFDNSCFQIIDVKTLEQVAEFYSDNVPLFNFAQIIHLIAQYYNNALVVVEDMYPGNSVITQLQNVLGYENLYYEDNKKPGVKSSKAKRPKFLISLRSRLIEKTIKINSFRFGNELNTFYNNPVTQKPEAQRGKHDDAILALALAVWAMGTQEYDLPVGADASRETQEILNSQTYKHIRDEIMRDMLDEEILRELDKKEVNPYSEFYDQDNPAMNLRRKHGSILKEFGW